MKIAVNIQPLLHSGKSGIGFYQQELIKAFFNIDREDQFFLQYFRPRKCYANVSAQYLSDKISDDSCNWFGATLYQLLWAFLPIPYRWFFRSRPDVTMFFNYYLPPMARGKKVLVVYDTVIKDYPETIRFKTKLMLRLTLKKSIRRADKIITISQFSKNQIIKYYHVNPDDIVIIPCAADDRKFHPPSDREAVRVAMCGKYRIGGEYYLYLGNLEPRKNITRLVEAYSQALNQNPNIPLLVIGGGKGWLYEEIFRRVKELRLDKKVIFTGYVDDDDVPLLMSGAKAFCFPSLYEGFGMPPLEAMSCGVPVIVSNTSSLPEVVGEHEISVDPYNVEEISEALLKVLDEESSSRWSKMGVQRAKSFSWNKSAEVLLRLIKELGNEQNQDSAD